ncbi:thiopeptide-type bacteriocin biosynthesis protein [Kitasatospora terrestris]|uniref:Thiopeptide-type bacteriocin biosynthesis domain-containing protein n=1 Tax=Kitasatospora terrestris TaxID=258051 RepID=A0ABP9DEK3_9ACTN
MSAELRWHSWHLHVPTADPAVLDRVLLACVPGALRMAGPSADGTPRPWFYLRYWQRGPHLRLRIADLTENQADDVEAELARSLAEVENALPVEGRLTAAGYAELAAPLAALGEYGSSLPAGELLTPGVHRAAYEPEVERYGGPDAMAAAEQLFHVSSVVCLRACAARAGQAGRGRTLLDGLELLAAALPAWPDQEEFLHANTAGWRALLNTTPPDPAALQAKAEALLPCAPALRRLAAGESGRWSPFTRRLAVATAALAADLGPGRARQILASHLHMAHNRLGLGLATEAQLAMILLSLGVVDCTSGLPGAVART